MGSFDPVYYIQLDLGGAPIPVAQPDGTIACGGSLTLGPASGNSFTESGVRACGDLVSGGGSVTATLCSPGFACGKPGTGPLSVAAAQYKFTVSPTVIPFGSQATATLTRTPSLAGFYAPPGRFYTVTANLIDCKDPSIQNLLQITFGGNGLAGLYVPDTSGQNTFVSSASFLPGDITCTVTAYENPNGNGFPSSNPFGIVGSVSVTFKAGTSSSLDLGSACPRSGAENMCGSPINLTNGNTWLQEDDYELPGLGGGISVRRTWNSEWSSNSPWTLAGLFGDSWQSTYERHLQVLPGNTQLRYWRADGGAWLFNISRSSYSLASPADERATLTFSNKSGYTLTNRDGSVELYDANGNLTALQDRKGNKTTLTYDTSSFHRLTNVTDAAGRVLTFNYTNSVLPKQVTSIQDSVGTVATYAYDSGSHLLSVTYADNSVINYTYDGWGQLLNSTDQQGKILEAHTYDPFRRGLTSQRANGVDLVSITYNSSGQATLTDSRSNSTSYGAVQETGSRWYVTNIQGPGCDSCGGRNNQTFAYDTSGNRTSSSDPNGNQTTYSYDSNGNVTQISKNLGTGTQASNFTWNSFGEVLTATDPLGKVTTNTYDTKGNMLTTQTPLGNTTTFTYDTKGELLTIKDPRLNVTTLTYTTAGLLASIKDAQNNLTQFQYDARANRTAVIDALNQTTSYTYDSRNRLTKITYPTSPATSVQFGYDYRGRRTSVTDANNKVTQYSYDDADRLVTVTDAATNATTYAYDTENNLTSITDAATNKTSFAYDPLGRLTQTTFPSNLTESYIYDNNGNVTSKTDRNNKTITYGYDAANRLTSKAYPDMTSVAYTYDLANHLTQVVDPTGTYGFTLDANGRLTQTSTRYSFITGKTFTVGYGYDAAANRTSMTDPQNAGTTYMYDTLNRLSSLTSPQGPFGFSYDALSRRTQLTRPNSVTTTYSYDPISRLLSVLHKLGTTTLDGATYTVDAAGNRTSKADVHAAVTTNYSYDPIYQLTQAAQGLTTTESYSFDPVGNRLSSLGVSSYSYNNSNELTAAGTVTYTYDNNGNTLTRADSTGTTTYAWDFENRLTSVTLPGTGGTVVFKYDPFGRRIQKSSSSGIINYVNDADNVFEEVDNAGNLSARYTQGLTIDEPLAVLRSGTTSFYQADGIGSITSLSSTTGTLASTYTYDSFGNMIASTGTLTNPFRYASREFDLESNLYFYRARYYNPNVGRFVSEDPLGFGGATSNFYSYVANGPIDNRDPFGLRPLTNCEKIKLYPYIPRIDLDRADIRENQWPPKIGKVFPIPLSKDVAAITLGNNIYIRPGEYDPDTIEGLALLGHELVHVGQYRTKELTELKYINELIKHGSGTKNKYEAPAYAMGDDILFSLPAYLQALRQVGALCACDQ